MIAETVETVQMHLSRAAATREELSCFLETLSADDFSNPERVKVIDAFLFHFNKIQDLMGNKLFREVLGLLGEYDDYAGPLFANHVGNRCTRTGCFGINR